MEMMETEGRRGKGTERAWRQKVPASASAEAPDLTEASDDQELRRARPERGEGPPSTRPPHPGASDAPECPLESSLGLPSCSPLPTFRVVLDMREQAGTRFGIPRSSLAPRARNFFKWVCSTNSATGLSEADPPRV